MKYERIERSLEETIEFCDKLAWSLTSTERDLILGKIQVEQYLDEHRYQKRNAQKFVDFFFKKIEEFEEGHLCWFYDDNLEGGRLATFNGYAEDIFYKDIYNDKWLNCISIEEFIKRLKDYL